jgi:putative restriction endonuclease
MDETTSRLWILKSKGEESSFGGNTGYADNPVAEYVYDTNVPNCGKVKEGDHVIITDKKFIKGYAVITSIRIKENVPKTIYRCPKCKTHEHYERKTIQPKYKCRKKHEFDLPDEKHIVVNEFTAHYGTTFVPAISGTSVKILDPYYLNRNIYYSIQAADTRFFDEQMPGLWKGIQRIRPVKTLVSAANVPPYQLNDIDARKRKNRNVVVRSGQSKFKSELIKYYDHYCMITGCDIQEAIEASHIFPYRGKNDNNPRNGLLLRTDLHELFDADLLGIDPGSMTVQLHPRLINSYYTKWQGSKIVIDRSDLCPSAEALQYRWKTFTEKAESFSRKN